MPATIALIGGGEIGRPGTIIETMTIDRHIKSLATKANPSFLFIPTASNDSKGYMQDVEEHFGKRVGYTNISHLMLHSITYTQQELTNIINQADVIYVGGGNTKMMIDKRNETGLADILKQSYRESSQTKIFCGLSAGSICRCRAGVSDSLSFDDSSNTSMIKVDALDLIPVIHSPHQIRESHRLYELMQMVQQHKEIGLAIDDSACVVFHNNQRSVIVDKINPQAGAYKVWNDTKKIYIQRFHTGESGSTDDLYANNHVVKTFSINDSETVIE